MSSRFVNYSTEVFLLGVFCALVFKKVFKRKEKTREIIFWVDRKTDKKVRIATS